MKCKYCSSYILFGKTTLICGHAFHKKCIKGKETCPFCNDYIFKDLSLKILKSEDQQFIQTSISKINKTVSKKMLKKAIQTNNVDLITALTTKVKNIKILAFDFIKEENIEALNRLMLYYKIKTNVKYTMLDIAISSQKMHLTNAVINIVGSKVEYNYFHKYQKPSVTKPTPMVKISGRFNHSMLPSGDLFSI